MMSSSANPDHKLHLVPSTMGHQQDCHIGNAVSSPSGHLLTPLSGVQSAGGGVPYHTSGYMWPQQNTQSPAHSYGFSPSPSSYQQHRTQQLYSPVSDAGAVTTPGHDGQENMPHPYDMSAQYPVTSSVGMSSIPRTRSNMNLHLQQQQQQQSSPTVHSPSDFPLSRPGYYPQHSISPHHTVPFSYPSPAPNQQSHLYNRSFTYPIAGQLPSPQTSGLAMGTNAGGMMVPSYGASTMSAVGHPMQPLFGHPHSLGPQSQAQQMQDRPFKCNECPQSFNRNHDLKRHKRIHLDVKPFPCGHCDKSFSRKDALKRHILVKGCGKNESSGTGAGADAEAASTEGGSPGESIGSPASTTAPMGKSGGRVASNRERMSASSSVTTPAASIRSQTASVSTDASPGALTPTHLHTGGGSSVKLSPASSLAGPPFSSEQLYPVRSMNGGSMNGLGIVSSVNGGGVLSRIDTPPLSLSLPMSQPSQHSVPSGDSRPMMLPSMLPSVPSLGSSMSGTGSYGGNEHIDPQVMAAAGVE